MSDNQNPHAKVEKNVGLMAVLIAVAVSFGGLAEIVPLMFQAEAIEPLEGVEPYPALELAGRDIYVREGCYNCHSQMVRTLRFESEPTAGTPSIWRYLGFTRPTWPAKPAWRRFWTTVRPTDPARGLAPTTATDFGEKTASSA